MPVNVFSKNWYKVEALKPQLKRQVEISSQQHREEQWYVLRDGISGTIQRYSWQAYQLIGLMDGKNSLHEIWENSGDQLEEQMPTQDEVISLVASLYQSDMIHLDLPANARDLFQRKQKKEQKKLLQKIQSPLSLQIPLFDPTSLLDQLCPLLEKVMGWKLLFLYLITIGFAGVMAWQHFDALTSNLSDRVLAAENLVLIWILYPLIKIVHELGHAYAVRHYGGQVTEVGIMFLVFFPMPYVNASESATFENKYQRIIVSAAGILVELLIAAVALFFWTQVEGGLLKSILFNIVFMAGVSTLLFNGNPLLKFDAYFMLSDYLEIPNLAKKATSYWGFLFKRYIFGLKEERSPSADKRESFWLFFYNLLSFSYRLFISISIILFVGSQYFLVGIVLAIWAFISGWLIPFSKTVAKPFTEYQFKAQGRNPVLVMGLLIAFCWALLFEVPMPRTITVEGVTWVEEHKRLYANESGFITEELAQAGDSLKEGQTILSLQNYELEGQAAVLETQLEEAIARYHSLYNDPAKYLLASEEISRLQQELSEIQTSLNKARVTCQASGKLVLSTHTDLVGRYLQRGEVIGYVMDDSPLALRILLPEHFSDQVESEVESIVIRAASDRQTDITSDIVAMTPQVTQVVPSLVLSEQAGGVVVMDPTQSEEPTAVENYILLSVKTANLPLNYVEERFYVRFNLVDEAIFWRIYRLIRRTFLEHFDV